MKRVFANIALASALCVTPLLAVSSSASAASGGYGPTSAVPVGVPGGFVFVLRAGTLPPYGGKVVVKDGAFILKALLAAGSFRDTVQVAFTKANLHSVDTGLRGNLHGDKAVLAAGFVTDRNGHALGTKHSIVVSLSGSELKKGDILAEFVKGRFVPVGRVRVNGTVSFAVHGVTEFAVLVPKA